MQNTFGRCFWKHLWTSWFLGKNWSTCNFTIAELFSRKLSNIYVSNILRHVNNTNNTYINNTRNSTAELRQTKMWKKWHVSVKFSRHKSKLDVFLWYTIVKVKFSEAATRVALLEALFYRSPPDDCLWVSTKRYWQIYRL